MKEIEGGVCAAKGFSAGGVYCGIRRNATKRDLALIVSDRPCSAAAVYTRNKVQGAQVAVDRDHLKDGIAQAILCNSGNANTCNADGEQKARATAAALARELKIRETDVAVASTGVIGVPLPLDPILQNIGQLAKSLSADAAGSYAAAEAIMTTDTHVKQAAAEFSLGGKTCRIGGICKGSGMIEPDLGTMLCFITTDAAVSSGMLQKALSEDVKDTFNMVSVDGDTSTNDTVLLLANGEAENPEITGEGPDFAEFQRALRNVTARLCREIARDGEGATHQITCTVRGAGSDPDARKIAKSVIRSALFKCAVFGCDANWGRILCAMGYSGAEFDPKKIAVWLSSPAGRILVCENGGGIPFDEDEALKILQCDQVTVEIVLQDGDAAATAWGCDLSYDYVKINGDYRS